MGGVWLLPLENAGTHGGTTKSSVGGTNNNINGIKCKYSLHKSLIPASFIFDTTGTNFTNTVIVSKRNNNPKFLS